jgi:hypothetical protein
MPPVSVCCVVRKTTRSSEPGVTPQRERGRRAVSLPPFDGGNVEHGDPADLGVGYAEQDPR